MASRGKRYNKASELIEEGHEYIPSEAVGILKKTATAKFDETVELHLRTGADPRHADQQVRGISVLPHGIGKQVRVLVFAQGETILAAKECMIMEFAGEVIPEETPMGDSQSNGRVEGACRRVQGMIRTIKDQVEKKYKKELDLEHPAVPWLVPRWPPRAVYGLCERKALGPICALQTPDI